MRARTRIVLVQTAIVLAVAAWATGSAWAFAALPLAALALVLAVAQVRHRSLARWLADGATYLARRRILSLNAGPAGLLALVRPGASTSTLEIDDADVGVLEDTDGLTAIVRVGDPSKLLGTASPPLPPLSALLPAPARDVPEVRVQLLVTAASPPSRSPTPSATSYRQLTDGRILAHQRVLVAVRVRRAGGYQRPDLEQSLTVAVRRACRVLTKAGLPARPLSAASALAAIAEAAHHDPSQPLEETWTALRAGGLHQATFRLRRWPDDGPPMSRLLNLPTTATTVSLTAAQPTASTRTQSAAPAGAQPAPSRATHGTAAAATREPTDRPPARAGRAAVQMGGAPKPAGTEVEPTGGDVVRAGGDVVRAELVVRLAAPSAAALAQATTALQELFDGLGAQVTRLDGAQLDGLAATLPLGGGAPGADAMLAGLVEGHDGLVIGGGSPAAVGAPRLAAIEPAVGGEGLMLGVNRHGGPVVVRLFRPTPTRAALIGGLRCAQLVIVRALATGAHVAVQSARPQAWEPFQRGVGYAEPLTVLPPGRLGDPPPPSATRPQLLVLDVGPTPARANPIPESAWRTVLHIRDDLTSADTDLLARSDLALLQPLSPHEAALAGDALGLGSARRSLSRISGEMLGIVINRRTVRWAHMSATPIEHQLIGKPSR
ncbi:type VII secretion protein EccE [Dactylosporangium sp. CA-092794]|uniref:type VII secretion protein EccE n=1 Tax=Dactylosporangium sp. CA-092794 TaxID=3239929 RepID=UPI003D9380AD